MKCEYCGRPIGDGELVCPACGAPVTGEKNPERKKVPVWQIVLMALGIVAVLGVLVWSVLFGLDIDLNFPGNGSEDASTTATTEPAKRTDGIFSRDSYTVDDALAAQQANTVIATAGDETLTNSELQAYYWTAVVEYLTNNYYYLSALGLDYTQPLSQQTCYLDQSMTWEQFFLHNSISIWHRYTTLGLLAKEENHQIDQELQEYLDGIPQSLQLTATTEGFETAEEFLRSQLGPASTLEGYLNYWNAYHIGESYFAQAYEKMIPNEEEINAYFTENEAALTAAGITKDMGRIVNVRHILVVPESAKENGSANGVACPQEEWDACLKEAERILEEWKSGKATAESFGQLAGTYSVDPGSKTKGGLYSNVTPGYMVPEFDAWIQDESNQAGATGIVKTVHGYHVMYLDGVVAPVWLSEVKAMMIEERAMALVENAIARWPIAISYDKIVLGNVDLG